MPAWNNIKKSVTNTAKLFLIIASISVVTHSITADAATDPKKKPAPKSTTAKAKKAPTKTPAKKAPVKKQSAKAKEIAKAREKPSSAKPRPIPKSNENLKATDDIPTSKITNPGAFESGSKQAFLLDYTTNTILYDKNGSMISPPASLTKVMTAYVVFQQIKDKKVKFSDKLCTSRYAATRGGTKMFLKENQCTELQYLLYGLLTMSGNDAAMTIAEGIGGSEEAFIGMMNDTAKRIGMINTHFANPNGLPNPDHHSTVRDLALLAKTVLDDFPQYYPFFGKKVFEYNGIVQPNRNKLINEGLGVDGFKTGFTVASGYAIIVSAERDGRRIIGVVNGNPTAKKRLDEARRIVAYAFDEFEIVKLFEKEKTIDKMRVWGGNVDYVNLYSPTNIQFVVRKSTKATAKYRTEILFKEPWKAPLKANTHAANLAVYENDKLRATYPLYTSTDVGQGTFTESIVDKFKLLTNSDDKNKRKK